jgi:DNA-binding transcriptional regulator/RsmH inhibitor MraZ
VEDIESNSQVLPVELPRGKYAGRRDDKARLKLPVDFVQFFKGLPETKMFLTSLDRRIATLYPIAEWRANERFFYTFRANPAAAKRILFNAQDLGGDVEMDAQGRITVHPDLRRELHMEGQELHLMAEKGHIQIMTEPIYQELKRVAMEQPGQDLELLEMEGLR